MRALILLIWLKIESFLKKAMEDIGLETPRAQVAKDFDKALLIQKDIGYPIIIRPSFTLGGSGGGIAYNKQDFEKIVKRGLRFISN